MEIEKCVIVPSSLPVFACDFGSQTIFLRKGAVLDAEFIEALLHEELHLILLDLGEIEASQALNVVNL